MSCTSPNLQKQNALSLARAICIYLSLLIVLERAVDSWIPSCVGLNSRGFYTDSDGLNFDVAYLTLFRGTRGILTSNAKEIAVLVSCGNWISVLPGMHI